MFYLAVSYVLSFLIAAVWAGILFAAAGRCDLLAVWVFLTVLFVPGLVLVPFLHRRSPGLIKERLRPGPGERDRVTAAAVVLLFVGEAVIAGLDIGRYHWSGRVPAVVQIVAMIGLAAGNGLALWATWANPFFSSAVRIQADRGQYVVATGPYRYVRHPGYTGALLLILCTGPGLGSWWLVVPNLVLTGVLVRRTALEDRMLRQELAGYAEYVEKVRHRLVPGVW